MKNTTKRIITAISIIALAFVFFSNLGAVKSIASKLKAKTAPSVVYPSAMEIETAMKTARSAAYRYASKEIDSWIDELMYRVDNAFLGDYFSFVQVKKREITSLFYSIRHFFDSDSETAEEIITRELEKKLSDIVIKPEQSQFRINEITKGAVGVYMETFGSELARLQIEYKIPVPEWNKYISDICGLTLDVNQKAYPVKLKMAVVSGTALSLVSVAPVVKKIASTASKKMAARAGAKAGAKIVGKVAAKAGVQAAGRGAAAAASAAIPYVGLGITAAICLWDIIDFANTSAEGKRMLRASLVEYFAEIKTEMLGSGDASIMGSLDVWENNVKEKIKKV